MLTRPGASSALAGRGLLIGLLIGLCGSVAAAETLFGIPLEAATESGRLGASRSGAPADLRLHRAPGQDATRAAAVANWDGAGYWYHARPLKLPKILRGSRTELQAAVNDSQQLFWLLLQASVEDCSASSRWLRDALSRKYGAMQWQPGPDPDSQLLRTGTLQIALSCNSMLTLEYLFPELRQIAYDQQFDEGGIFLRTKEERDRAYVNRLRLQYESRDWLRGSRTRIESYLGLQAMHGNPELVGRPADVRIDYHPRLLSTPFPAAVSHEITVDPEGRLIRLQSESSDPDRALERRLLNYLEALFGEPYRGGRVTQRFRIGYQWLVLRHRDETTSLVYLNQRLQEQQKERARLAEEARFAADTEGL